MVAFKTLNMMTSMEHWWKYTDARPEIFGENYAPVPLPSIKSPTRTALSTKDDYSAV
jgi:hypothetical protein